MSVSFLTTLVCRAEAVPAYSKSLFSPKKRATNIEPVYNCMRKGSVILRQR